MNTYIILANSKTIIDTEIKKIVGDSTNIIDFDLKNNTLNDLIEEASYTSLFDDKKYILCNTDIFSASKKEDFSLLEKFIEHGINSTIIFISNKKLDERKSIVKKLKKQVVDYLELKDLDARSLIEEKIISNGYEIDSKALNYIFESCLGHFDIISLELDKLFLYKINDKKISYNDAKEVVSVLNDDNIFKFTNAVINKDLLTASELIDQFKIIGIEPVMLNIVLYRQYRLIYLYKLNEHLSKDIIIKNLKCSPNQYWHISNNAKLYDKEELEIIIKKLLDTDYNIKSGKLEKYLALKSFLLEFN